MVKNFTDNLAKTLAALIAAFVNNNILYDNNTTLDFDKVVSALESTDPKLAKQFKKWKGTSKVSSTSYSSSRYDDGGWCGRVSNYGCGSTPSRGYSSGGCGSSSYSSRYSC